MTRILKYTLRHHGETVITIPARAILRHVDNQCDALQLWAEVDDTKAPEERTFFTVYTGFDDVPEDSFYVGTALSQGGSIVSHVYELPKDRA